MDPKERAEDFFSRYAPAYTESVSHRSGGDLQRLIALLQPQGHGRLLDVATGPGHTAFAMAPYVEAVVGLDLTPAMAREFRRQADSSMQAIRREEWQTRIEAAGLQVRALEMVEELLPWERWWAPVPPDGPAAVRACAFAASGGPEAEKILLHRPEGWVIRKRRMIRIASHALAHPSCKDKERSESRCAVW